MEQPASWKVLAQREVTVADIQKQARAHAINHFLWQGWAGPMAMALVLVVGLAAFQVALDSSIWSLAWVAGITSLGLVMLLLDLRDRKVFARALDSALRKRFGTSALLELGLRQKAQTGLETFMEIWREVDNIVKRHGEEPHLHRVLGHSLGMLALQLALAEHVAELEAGENQELHQEEVNQAYSLAQQALTQLEAVKTVLQELPQLPSSRDVATGVAELEREAEETVRRLQARARNPGDGPAQPDRPAPARGPDRPRPLNPDDSDLAWQHMADRYSSEELARLRQSLQRRLARLNFGAGLQALSGLVREYAQLRSQLAHSPHTISLISSQTITRSEEVYHRGMSILGSAAALAPAAGEPQRDQLEREISELEERIAAAGSDTLLSEELTHWQDQLDSQHKRLDSNRRRRFSLEKRLDQCHHIETSLEEARTSLALLRADSAGSRISEVTQPLDRVIEQAIRLQEELNREDL